MIKVTKLNGDQVYINDDLIEFIESTPDTIISLTTGRKIIIKESMEFVVDRVVEFRKKVFSQN